MFLMGLPLGLCVAGCATPHTVPEVPTAAALFPAKSVLAKDPAVTLAAKPAAPEDGNPLRFASAEEADESPKKSNAAAPGRLPDPASTADPARVRPAYAQLETLPIDLPTVINLVSANSPAAGVARARVREAEARLESAEVQWLPNLAVGAAYQRFDGRTQNQRGELFDVSRANLLVGGGPALALDVAEAIYRPLVERRLTAAERLRAAAVDMSNEMEAAGAYIDLVQVHAQLAINADTLEKAEAMLTAARNAKEARLDRTAGDVNRARTEVLSRRAERAELEGRAGAASARLGRLLLLRPGVRLVPTDMKVAPVTFIEPTATLDQLVTQAVGSRPDLAANREAIEAAWARVRREQYGPLLPKVTLQNQSGTFGGGINNDLQDFAGRNALSLQVFWEVRNLGFGNRADINGRQAQLDQAQFQAIEAQARVAAEIVETAQMAAARMESLDLAEKAVKEATELYRINKEGTTNVVDAKNLFDALRPLQAIQALNQARLNYLNAVLDYNRAQYRLFIAVGRPAPETSSPVLDVTGTGTK